MIQTIRKYKNGFLVASIPLILIIILFLSGSLAGFESILLDFRHKYMNPGHAFSDKIILIDIDDAALKTYARTTLFGRWPWKRSVYPPIVQFIAQGNPKIILFDILFTESSPEDSFLAEMNSTFPLVSHAIYFKKEQDPITDDLPEYIKKHSVDFLNNNAGFIKEYNEIAYPVESISNTAHKLHTVNFDPDHDGVARRANLAFQYHKTIFPSLSMVAFDSIEKIKEATINKNSAILNTEKRRISIPLSNEKYRLYYYKKETLLQIPRYSISGIIDSIRQLESEGITDLQDLKINPFQFQDKIIIIGTSAASTHDTKLLPYGNFPGFVFHSTLLSNLLEQHFLTFQPDWLGLIYAVLLNSLCIFMLFHSTGFLSRILLPSGIFLIAVTISFLLFYKDLVVPISGSLISVPLSLLIGFGYLTLTEGTEKRKYTKVLRNMIDPSIVDVALHDLELLKKGAQKEITAFFSDVEGFTNISEKLEPADLASLLNEYLSAMTKLLKSNYGTLDKYIGDAIVGIFGAPVDEGSHSLNAARASVEMIQKLNELKKFWRENNLYIPEAYTLNIRIGLNTGIAKVGFMGTDDLASYTMMGDTVNLAARLESAGKDYGVSILISEAVKKDVENEMFMRNLDLIRVKGKKDPVRIYELISLKKNIEPSRLNSVKLYEEAFQFYSDQKWDEAIQKFRESESVRGSTDKAVTLLIQRCEFYKQNPPGKDWDGVYTRTSK